MTYVPIACPPAYLLVFSVNFETAPSIISRSARHETIGNGTLTVFCRRALRMVEKRDTRKRFVNIPIYRRNLFDPNRVRYNGTMTDGEKWICRLFGFPYSTLSVRNSTGDNCIFVPVTKRSELEVVLCCKRNKNRCEAVSVGPVSFFCAGECQPLRNSAGTG